MPSNEEEIKLSITPTLQSAIQAQSTGNWSVAEATYHRILETDPSHIDARNNLGVLYRALGKLSEAEIQYQHAITLRPDFLSAIANLANLLMHSGRFYEAEKYYRECIKIAPKSAIMRYRLGNALLALHRYSEAAHHYRKAIQLKPDLPEAYTDLGNALQKLNFLYESEDCHRKAISLKVDYFQAYNNLGYILSYQGRLIEAIENFKIAVELKPDLPAIQSNVLFYMNYMPEISKKEQFLEAKRYGEIVRQLGSYQYQNWHKPTKDQKIRIGFLSGDFRDHPVAHFLQGLLSNMDLNKFELFAYCTDCISDNVTELLKKMFTSWNLVFDTMDADIAEKIYNDRIQILIDLSGHTARNRLPIFAFKPAPIQITWLGYCATTGLPEIDYVIGDPFVTPVEDDQPFVEQIWRLPECYLNWTPPNLNLAVSKLPALENGFVTFGSFNNFIKINDGVLSIWARILRSVLRSKLYFKSGQLGDLFFQKQLLARMATHGISPERLIIEGGSNRMDYYEAFSKVDIALDPFPFPGATTTVDSLWMGVPVIIKKGNCFLSRNGETIARNCGQEDWIAIDDDEYVSKAIYWSTNLKDLGKIRTNLRSNLLESPLCDSHSFARNFEVALTEMYRRSQVSGIPFSD